jgi:AraC-like DNA-binding protein
MADAAYEEFPPPPELSDVVRCLWRFRSDRAESEPQHIAPDGCAEAIIHLGAPYWEVARAGAAEQPPILFAGQITQPLVLQARGAVDVLGVRFRPDGARAFHGSAMKFATNKRTDLRLLHGEPAVRLLDAARARGASSDAFKIVSAYVADTIKDARLHFHPEVRASVQELEEAGPLGIEWIGSERRSQRLFADWVGVPPRMLVAIFRFRRVFNAIERGAGWVTAALDAGYFDQPQMVRDFRRFLDCTPRDWAIASTGLSKALVKGGLVSG